MRLKTTPNCVIATVASLVLVSSVSAHGVGQKSKLASATQVRVVGNLADVAPNRSLQRDVAASVVPTFAVLEAQFDISADGSSADLLATVIQKPVKKSCEDKDDSTKKKKKKKKKASPSKTKKKK